MSIRAVAYVRELVACEDGAELTAGQKLMLLVLADYHNAADKSAWPSMQLLAKESLVSVSQARRWLKYLELHCTLARRAPKNQGRGDVTEYLFLVIDEPRELATRLNAIAKGCQDDTLFSEVKRVSEGFQNQGKRVSEGCQKRDRYKEEPRTKSNQNRARGARGPSCNTFDPNHTQESPAPALPVGANEQAAVEAWRTISGEIREESDLHSFDTWLKPVRPRYVLGGELYLQLPSLPFLQIVSERYRKKIDECCVQLGMRGAILTQATEEAT